MPAAQHEPEETPGAESSPAVGQGVPRVESGVEGLGIRTSGGGLRPPTPSSVEPSGMPTRPTCDPSPIPVGDEADDDGPAVGLLAVVVQVPDAFPVVPPPSKIVLEPELPVADIPELNEVPGIELPMPEDACGIAPPILEQLVMLPARGRAAMRRTSSGSRQETRVPSRPWGCRCGGRQELVRCPAATSSPTAIPGAMFRFHPLAQRPNRPPRRLRSTWRATNVSSCAGASLSCFLHPRWRPRAVQDHRARDGVIPCLHSGRRRYRFPRRSFDRNCSELTDVVPIGICLRATRHGPARGASPEAAVIGGRRLPRRFAECGSERTGFAEPDRQSDFGHRELGLRQKCLRLLDAPAVVISVWRHAE